MQIASLSALDAVVALELETSVILAKLLYEARSHENASVVTHTKLGSATNASRMAITPIDVLTAVDFIYVIAQPVDAVIARAQVLLQSVHMVLPQVTIIAPTVRHLYTPK